jgi:predicted ATPase
VFRLEEIEIEGYRSIRQATVQLRGLNVLIGANGAGKSNLLGALRLLGDMARGQLQLHVARRGGAHSLLHFGRKKTPKLRLSLRFAPAEKHDPTRYDLLLEAASGDTLVVAEESLAVEEWPIQNPFAAKTLAGSLELTISKVPSGIVGPYLPGVFHFNDTGPSAAIKEKHAIDDNHSLRPDGKNLAALLYGLKQRAPRSYREIVESIQAVAPFFKDFALRPDAVNPKVIQLEWEHRSEPDDYFNADSLSDGTLRFICLATLLLQPDKPSLILLDEPELGLHPAAIIHVAELLRMVSKTTQILVTTQSVTLLEQFAPEDVIVVERKDEESVFRRLDEASLSGWLEDCAAGKLQTPSSFDAPSTEISSPTMKSAVD